MIPADLIGQRFGRLVCVALVGVWEKRRVWRWRCDCGTEFDHNANSIQQGRMQSCGCLRRETNRINLKHQHGGRRYKRTKIMTPSELAGQRFGRLVCLSLVGTKNGRRVWHWRCDCGTEFDLNANAIQQGRKQSCGCLLRESQAHFNDRITKPNRGGRKLNLIGMTFGRLTVEAELPERGRRGNVVWRCRCTCGGTKDVQTALLRGGFTLTCGQCKRSSWKKLDLVGQKFGRLTVVSELPERGAFGDVVWHCVCECGRTKAVTSRHLRGGHVVSCGCRLKECQRENWDASRNRRALNKRGSWLTGLFSKPYIRPRKGRKVKLMDGD